MAADTIYFTGAVACQSRVNEALGIVLRGVERTSVADISERALEVGFVLPAPHSLPLTLTEVAVEELEPAAAGAGGLRRFAITSAQGRFEIEARSVHVHRDARATFFAAVPPRPAPPARRLFFWLVPRLAASAPGRALLRRLRAR